MIRGMQKRRYFFVLVATILVFSFGLLLGMTLNDKKVNMLEKMAVVQNLDALSLQLQFTYLNSLNINSTEGCKVMNAALETSWANLASSYINLVKYKDGPDVDAETVKILERNDFLNNVRYWFLLERVKGFCELEDSVSALFFFSDKDCDGCGAQSTLLEHYKKVFGDRFLLFHINIDTEDPMVEFLLRQYGVQAYPTTVIGEGKFEGVMQKDELKKVICTKFRTEQPECRS